MTDSLTARLSASDKIVVIKKTSWLMGMHWETSTSVNNARKRAKEVAKLKALETYAIHVTNDGTVEFGVSTDKKTQRTKTPSLASALVAVKPGSWIAFFQLPDGRFYLVSSRNGAIDPQSDAIFDSQDEAYNRLMALDLAQGNRCTIYAPESLRLGTDRNEPWSFADATATLKPNARLVSVDPTKVLRAQIVRGVLVLTVASAAWYAYKFVSESGPAKSEKPPEIIPAAPWNNAESGIEQVAYCLQGFLAMPATAPGWGRTTLVCKNGAIQAAFTRAKPLADGGAPRQWLVDALRTGGWPIEGYRSTDKDTNYVMPIPIAKTIWKDHDVKLSIKDYLSKIISRFDNNLIEAAVSTPEGKYYVAQKLTIKTKSTPMYYLHQLADVKGLTLDSVTRTSSDYTVVFIMHEIGKLPAGVTISPPPAIRKFQPEYAKFFASTPAITN